MKNLILLLLALFSVLVAFNQSPAVQWGKYVNKGSYGTTIYHAAATMDGGFVVCGADSIYSSFEANTFFKKKHYHYSLASKYNSNGDKQWAIPFWKWGVITTIGENSSGLIFCSGKYPKAYLDGIWVYDFTITVLDKNGGTKWEKKYTGTKPSEGFGIDSTQTGFIACGFTEANDGDATGNHGLADAWVIKTDSSGNKIWAKCFGGSSNDTAFAVITVPDGYLIAGTTASTDGDAIGSKGGRDGWAIKLDTAGNIIWQKKFGGSGTDVLNSVQYDSQSNAYLFSGYSTSVDGDISNSRGAMDVWVLKTDTSGNLQWSSAFGGSGDDASANIKLAPDHSGYFVSGFSASNDGDVSGNAGGADAWLLRMDTNGKLVWQKCVGTTRNEFAMAAVPVSQSDVIIAGFAQAAPDPKVYSNCRGLIARLGIGNTITGKVFYDINRNGLFDNGETLCEQAVITVKQPDGTTKSTIAYDGNYMLGTDTGAYEVSVNSSTLDYYTAVPASVVISHNTYYNTDTIHFAIQPIPGIKDLSINLLPITPARPGFAVQYKLIAVNNGTEIIPSATVTLAKDSRLIYQNASPAPGTLNGNTLQWTLSNFGPMDTSCIVINFKAATPPTLTNGLTLVSVASIPLENDTTPSDNTYIAKQLVTGSYDPNDKREAHGGIVTEEQLASNDWLSYLIRFQNTGTDTAFTVIIKDTLSSKVNWNTLQLTDASHPYQVELEDGRITLRLDGIKLADSNHNEPKSHGYIGYRVKPNANVKAGDTILNRAAIYFDYNLPVVTNTALLKIIKETGATCQGGIATFTALQDNVSSYAWELNSGEGFGFISDNENYSGTHTEKLNITAPTSWTGNQYRCRMLLENGEIVYSDIRQLQFINTWLGTTNSNWHLPQNWECGVVPDAYTDVIIKPAVNSAVIIGNTSCHSVRLTGPNMLLFVKQGVQFTITGK